MKKHLTTAALLAAGTALANAYTVVTDDSFYENPAAWVNIWTGASDNAYDTAGNWSYLSSLSSTTTATRTQGGPGNADPVFIGYTLSFENGNQVLTSNDDVLSITAPTWFGGTTSNETARVYLGSNVTLSGSNNGFRNVTFNFGDFNGTSKISMGAFWKQPYTVSFAGSVTMTNDTFSYTLFESTAMHQNAGTWDASAVKVTDAAGNVLTYTDNESLFGAAGYYWLEENGTGTDQGAYSLNLRATAVPEPSAFGLLAGLGALALVASRRRRK